MYRLFTKKFLAFRLEHAYYFDNEIKKVALAVFLKNEPDVLIVSQNCCPLFVVVIVDTLLINVAI